MVFPARAEVMFCWHERLLKIPHEDNHKLILPREKDVSCHKITIAIAVLSNLCLLESASLGPKRHLAPPCRVRRGCNEAIGAETAHILHRHIRIPLHARCNLFPAASSTKLYSIFSNSMLDHSGTSSHLSFSDFPVSFLAPFASEEMANALVINTTTGSLLADASPPTSIS